MSHDPHPALRPDLRSDPTQPRQILLALFQAALAAADPQRLIASHLPEPPAGRTIVIGAGKAAAAMAHAVETHWRGPLTGLVVTRYGHATACDRIEVVEAGHPLPDAHGADAALRIRHMVEGLTADDLVLCLMSGGGSALLTMPADGISAADKRALNQALLASGAPISAINTVRKHVSAIKGGRLAVAAFPARVVTLAISDVPGDDPGTIASGPTVADASTAQDAIAILARYRIDPPDAVRRFLQSPLAETPKPGDPRLARAEFRIIATPRAALTAAAARAAALGLHPIVLGDAIEGEARAVGAAQAAIARDHAAEGQRSVLLSGGETTVTVKGHGRGGRNVEFLLGLALALDGQPGIHALACDTDGIDGTEDNAGAFLAPDSLARARRAGIDPAACLADNDAYRLFAAIGDLVITGPTRTNVNDFRAILIDG